MIARDGVEGIELESLSRLSLVAQGPFHRIRGTVGYDGGVRFEGLSPGRWWIEARLGDVGRRVSQVVTLEPGEDDAWVEAIPYEQTRTYVKKVLRSQHAYRVLY